MNLHEYQSKRLLAEYDIPVPRGGVAFSPEEARTAALDIGGERWVVKAQVHSGGRGKAGGVKLCGSEEEVVAAARELLGSELVTYQTGGKGLPVHAVLVEEVRGIAREIYLSLLVDRSSARVMFLASGEGGMDIETVAAEAPEKILSCRVHPATGFQPYQGRDIGYALGLDTVQVGALTRQMAGMYRLFLDKDLNQIEINPLIVASDGELLALDAKIGADDNALFAHPDLAGLRDVSQEDARENAAREHGLSYVTLDGNIGCMVNGAGLAMATMDMVKLYGGLPANFLDVGGGATAEKVAEAFKLILSDSGVRAVLVNIFGGIVRCDLIAEGLIAAVREVQVGVPVVVRLEGTNAGEGRALLERSGLAIIAANELDEAARKAVEAAA
ncbi:ADP-forming succinate--CoA ligase subunit beta [Methylococcus geothermalis]|uniref:Succinate--CoA ligase [ADP-forming] subunit beta n=1 Tax=Methylococcus geothermalis TaxID=2681310 RepID=A0A858Q858_9GAMM|nr:ADP-forming succinate--CoA ligase subunit beta [Methylococcus geothermalis]QJD30010.1 ADP-forming succinate--CoA ligase subunit beta [Methylococcus geothermalis]